MSFFIIARSDEDSRVDIRTKLVFVLLFTLLVFIVDKLPVAVCLLLFSVVMRFAAGVPFRTEGSRKFLFPRNFTLLAALIILIQMVFGPGSSYILKHLFPPSFPLLGGAFSLKWEGLILGLVIVCRLAALVIMLPVFTETTPPHKIAAGLCAIGLNYRIAFIITMAFNHISFFKDEALVIMEAQKLRGMRSFDRKEGGSLFSRLKAYTGLILPLMLGAMKKAQASSIAMDSRAFGIYKKRTWIDKPVMKGRDFACITGCIILFCGVFFVNFKLLVK